MRRTQYPGKSITDVIQAEDIKLQQIKATLRLNVGDFEKHFIPVLQRYAAFVHLLPASENHHHAWPGGLFSHGIEVALLASRASSKFLYGHRDLPRLQDTMEERWRLGIALAGLLHDVGKGFVGLRVVGPNGVVWNPYLFSLSEWLSQQQIDGYYIEWEKGRHALHEQLGSSMLPTFIPKEVMDHLTEFGGEIWGSIVSTIAGSNDDRKFGALIKTADQRSVASDLGHQTQEVFSAPRPRPEDIVLRTMRKLIDEKVWTWNTSRSRLWQLEGHTHLVWKAAVSDLFKVLDEDHTQGVPRDPDVLADLLIERGIAVARQKTDGTLQRYWIQKLPDIDKSPYLLRLIPDLIDAPNSSDRKDEEAIQAGFVKIDPQSAPTRESGADRMSLNVDHPATKIPSIDPELQEYFARLMPKSYGVSIVTKGDCLFLDHRVCARQLGIPAAELIKAIVSKQLHQPDPVIAQRDIQEHQGKLGLLLKKGFSDWVLSTFQMDNPTREPSAQSPSPETVFSRLLKPGELPLPKESRSRSKVRPWRHPHAE